VVLPDYIIRRISELEASADGIIHDVVGRVGGRDVVVVGVKTNIEVPVQIEDDPLAEEFARHVATWLPTTMCGPAVSGVSFSVDENPTCTFDSFDTSTCKYECAPLFVLRDGQDDVRVFPPCHGSDSPLCCKYASYCPSTPCVRIKARGCITKQPPCPCYYTYGFSFLDSTTDKYEFNRYALAADGKDLLYIGLNNRYVKNESDILYGFLTISIEYRYSRP
jgi:hypothetical protein